MLFIYLLIAFVSNYAAGESYSGQTLDLTAIACMAFGWLVLVIPFMICSIDLAFEDKKAYWMLSGIVLMSSILGSAFGYM